MIYFMHVRTDKEVIDVIKHRLIRRFAADDEDLEKDQVDNEAEDTEEDEQEADEQETNEQADDTADEPQTEQGKVEPSQVQQLVTQDTSGAPASNGDPTPEENSESANSALDGVSENGRTLLQAMAKWKYQISQCVRIAGVDDRTAKKIEQSMEIVDKAMAAVYSVCFAMDNLSIAPVYTEEQLLMNGAEDGYDLDEAIPEPVEEEPEEPVEEPEDNGEGDENEEGGMPPQGGGAPGEPGPADEDELVLPDEM